MRRLYYFSAGTASMGRRGKRADVIPKKHLVGLKTNPRGLGKALSNMHLPLGLFDRKGKEGR